MSAGDVATIESSPVGVRYRLHVDRSTSRVVEVSDDTLVTSAEQLQALRRAVVGLRIGPAFRFIQRIGNLTR